MSKKDKQYITALLLVSPWLLYAVSGLSGLIGSDSFMLLGLVVFGLMVFFTIVLPLIESFILFLGMKLIEKQNRKLGKVSHD